AVTIASTPSVTAATTHRPPRRCFARATVPTPFFVQGEPHGGCRETHHPIRRAERPDPEPPGIQDGPTGRPRGSRSRARPRRSRTRRDRASRKRPPG